MYLRISFFLAAQLILIFSCINFNNGKIAEDVCECLKNEEGDLDTVKLLKCFDLSKPYYLSFMSDSAISEKILKVDVYLAKNCTEYHKAIPINDNWSYIDENKILNDDPEMCKTFYNYKQFYYMEQDTTWVNIYDNIWEEKIEKDYFSKCYLIKDDSCAYALEFIESDHPYKKNMSTTGEMYYYKIISKEDGYFNVSTVFADVTYVFRLYYIE